MRVGLGGGVGPLVLWALFGSPSVVSAQPAQIQLLTVVEDFETGWDARWQAQTLGRGRTSYEVVEGDDSRALRATSEDAGSAMIRRLNLNPLTEGTITWRWKVARSLAANTRERERTGDDYAARLFVVFGSRGSIRDALCYVWASGEPPGSVYPSPYVESVAMIVLQSGDSRAGEWISERRDVLADYRAFFGEDPDEPTAIAVMVDTDDTGTTAEAWFDDIRFAVKETP
jgi:hypothetical protein